MKKRIVLEIIKFIIALIVGGILGVCLLEKGLSNGNVIQVLLFFGICAVVGFLLWKVGKK